ncbi:MAG: L-threonylcarbamoyladenylate synthase [Oscillochloridaceae bacterium umkhey_bin13]
MLRTTKVLAADATGVAHAAALLRAGGLVAFPTETVYGLGGAALNPQAVAAIFAAKGRPAEDPLIVHLASADELPLVTSEVPPLAHRLATLFWPGPLTLVLPRGSAVPPAVSAGRNTVAVRVPAHPLAQALIQAIGTPLAAPSANRFGHTSPTSAAHVLVDLDGRIDAVLDGGTTPLGLESTVLDLSGPTPTLLRPGGISLEQLETLLGPIAVATRANPGVAMPAPGMLDRHYAPERPLWLVLGSPAAALQWIRSRTLAEQATGQRVGLLLPNEDLLALADLAADTETLGSADDPLALAHNLYAALRALDARQPDVILARDFGEVGLARALSDRLRRAAAGRIVQAP